MTERDSNSHLARSERTALPIKLSINVFVAFCGDKPLFSTGSGIRTHTEELQRLLPYQLDHAGVMS